MARVLFELSLSFWSHAARASAWMEGVEVEGVEVDRVGVGAQGSHEAWAG